MDSEAPNPRALATREEVAALARWLFGPEACSGSFVSHVTALAHRPGGEWINILVGENAPKSSLDTFALRWSRARAAAILITGQILRAEPELRYELDESPDSIVFSAYREIDRLLDSPPILLVLSRGELDLAHPALHGWARPCVYTSEVGGERLARAALPVIVDPHADARAAVRWLRQNVRGPISIEAGPSVALPLYEELPLVDELLLSIFEGPVADAALGRRVLLEQALEAGWVLSHERRVVEATGPWRFRRYVRSMKAGA